MAIVSFSLSAFVSELVLCLCLFLVASMTWAVWQTGAVPFLRRGAEAAGFLSAGLIYGIARPLVRLGDAGELVLDIVYVGLLLWSVRLLGAGCRALKDAFAQHRALRRLSAASPADGAPVPDNGAHRSGSYEVDNGKS